MARLPDTVDRTRPTNKVAASGDLAGVSRGLAYEMARTGAWPSIRVGSRLLIKTKPFLALLGIDESDEPGPER